MEIKPFVDHPHPGAGLLLIMAFFSLLFLAAIPAVHLVELISAYQGLITILLVLFLLILIYGFWMVYNTSYELDKEGITVKFGFATTRYSWNEFSSISRRQGIFTLKIGWLGVTPCVRLTNAVVLRRENSRIPLFLTPRDPGDFLERIRRLQPALFESVQD